MLAVKELQAEKNKSFKGHIYQDMDIEFTTGSYCSPAAK